MKNLEEISKNIRSEVLKMTTKAKSGHPGGSLSIADILAVLYFDLVLSGGLFKYKKYFTNIIIEMLSE
jgi:transketolase N-terminal domain/subunit